MNTGIKYLITWLGILMVGVLSFLYQTFPEGETFYIGNRAVHLPYFLDWPTFIYHLSILLIPAIVATVSIIVLPRQSTSRPLLFLLGLMLFINCWFLWHLVDRLRYIEDHSVLATIVVASTVVFGVFLIRRYRGSSDLEKRLGLLKLLDQIDKEDLPAIESRLRFMASAANDMKEYHFAAGWKRIFKEETEMGAEITKELSKKVKGARKGHS